MYIHEFMILYILNTLFYRKFAHDITESLEFLVSVKLAILDFSKSRYSIILAIPTISVKGKNEAVITISCEDVHDLSL